MTACLKSDFEGASLRLKSSVNTGCELRNWDTTRNQFQSGPLRLRSANWQQIPVDCGSPLDKPTPRFV